MIFMLTWNELVTRDELKKEYWNPNAKMPKA